MSNIWMSYKEAQAWQELQEKFNHIPHERLWPKDSVFTPIYNDLKKEACKLELQEFYTDTKVLSHIFQTAVRKLFNIGQLVYPTKVESLSRKEDTVPFNTAFSQQLRELRGYFTSAIKENIDAFGQVVDKQPTFQKIYNPKLLEEFKNYYPKDENPTD